MEGRLGRVQSWTHVPRGRQECVYPHTYKWEQSILERSSQENSSDCSELNGRMLGLVSKIQVHWSHPRGYSIMSPKTEGMNSFSWRNLKSIRLGNVGRGEMCYMWVHSYTCPLLSSWRGERSNLVSTSITLCHVLFCLKRGVSLNWAHILARLAG